jgi:hypothetical protein
VFRKRAFSLALVGLFLWVTGCTTTYTQIELGEVADKDYVRVTLMGGEKTELHEPALDADSLRGRVKEVARIGGYRWSDSVVVIPLESVAEIAVGSNPTGEVLIGLGAVFVLLVLVGIAICVGDDTGYSCP